MDNPDEVTEAASEEFQVNLNRTNLGKDPTTLVVKYHPLSEDMIEAVAQIIAADILASARHRP